MIHKKIVRTNQIYLQQEIEERRKFSYCLCGWIFLGSGAMLFFEVLLKRSSWRLGRFLGPCEVNRRSPLSTLHLPRIKRLSQQFFHQKILSISKQTSEFLENSESGKSKAENFK